MDLESVVIAGTGPAGLTAAIYASRAGLDPLVIEGTTVGGQLTVSESVENFPGFPEPISGADLMARLRAQAERFGVRFMRGTIREVTVEDVAGGPVYNLRVKKEIIQTRTLIIATGAQARRLTVPGEDAFYGKGISGCVECDGLFYKDAHVLVVGGGNSAMHDALALTRIASRVTLTHRRTEFRADAYELDKVKRNPKVEIMTPWEITSFNGEAELTGVTLRNTGTGEAREMNCDGVFVAIGHDPRTEAFRSIVKTDSEGYIIVTPGSTLTSAPGIFACGDVCDPVYRQAVVAAGQGSMAAIDARKYLEKE